MASITYLQSLDKKLPLLLLGLAGVFTILYSTRWGVGLDQDSLNYIGAAESILRGQGFSTVTPAGEVRAITLAPPLFSLALTPFGFVGINMFAAARGLNALLFGINILFVGYIVQVNTTRLWPSIFASVLMLTSVDMIFYHSMALSEPLFIFLGLGALYFLDNYLQRSRILPLFLSALFISAATLTRYIGVMLIATLCISVIILGKRDLRQRIVDCLVAVLISSIPLLLWLVRNREVSRNEPRLASGAELAKAEFKTHLVQARHLKSGLDAISLWLLPPGIPVRFRVVLAAVVIASLLIIVWLARSGIVSMVYLNATYIVLYCLGLALSISFLSIDISFGSRYVLPVFVSIVLVLVVSLSRVSLKAKPAIRIAITTLCVLLSLSYLQRAAVVINRSHQDGMGWESPLWTQSKSMSLIRSLPNDVRVYSNFPISIGFLTHREIYALPYKLNPRTDEPLADYAPKLFEVGASSESRRTLLFYVNVEQRCFPAENELKQTLSVKEIERGPEGSLYEVLP